MALVPLALILGEVTEDLAVRFGDTAGGLLNATFGNVTELILSIAALTKGPNLYIVVAMSLIGSVLSNLLLVLGQAPLSRCPREHALASRLSMHLAFCASLTGCHQTHIIRRDGTVQKQKGTSLHDLLAHLTESSTVLARNWQPRPLRQVWLPLGLSC